ncbi:MAG: VOC family protein [Myxococcota bacterium]
MAETKGHNLYVNLPVRDLERSKKFFAALGFSFNPDFTDEKAACMVVSDDVNVMLLTEPFFKTFMPREVCDTSRHTEAILALSCGSRQEVDAMVDRAIAAGGARAMDPMEHGQMMYSWSFYDPDGHHWEVFWMDPNVAQA